MIGLYLDNQDSQVRMMVLGRKLHPMKWIGFFLYFCIWNLSKLVSIIDTGARFAGKVLHGTWPVQNNPWYNAYVDLFTVNDQNKLKKLVPFLEVF